MEQKHGPDLLRKKKPRKVEEHYPEDWVISYSLIGNGRYIWPGTELTITGLKGRYRFIKHVKTSTAEWIDVVGGAKGRSMTRSVHPSRVKTVHRVNKTRENSK